MEEYKNKTLTWQDVKSEIVSCANWLVGISSQDLEWTEDWEDQNIVVLEAITDSQNERQISDLVLNIKKRLVEKKLYGSKSMLLYLQVSKSNPLEINEMNKVDDLIKTIIPDSGSFEIVWGISQIDGNASRIVCAVNNL